MKQSRNIKDISAPELEKKLREEILDGLKKVTRANSPHLWSAIYKADGTLNVKGYQKIEERLIGRIISGRLTPLAAIPQLEQELDLM